MAIPTVLEIWSTAPDSVKFLQNMCYVVRCFRSHLRFLIVQWYAGGSLSTKVGNSLYNQGVVLASIYGATELGCPCHIIPADDEIRSGEWEWIRFDSRASIQWVSHGNDLFEAHFLVCHQFQNLLQPYTGLDIDEA